jgi:hypothetical protein
MFGSEEGTVVPGKVHMTGLGPDGFPCQWFSLPWIAGESLSVGGWGTRRLRFGPWPDYRPGPNDLIR